METELDGKTFTHIEWCVVIREEGDALEDALYKINNPTTLFGKRLIPYCIIFDNHVADSEYGGGACCIFGFQYSTDKYGAQVLIRFGTIPKYRNKFNGAWTEWKDVSTT